MRALDKQGPEVSLVSCRESGTTYYDTQSAPRDFRHVHLYAHAGVLPYLSLWIRSDSAFNKNNSIVVKFLAESDRWHYSSTSFGASFEIYLHLTVDGRRSATYVQVHLSAVVDGLKNKNL
jgi:hypothetical protein